jgi:hypothetical protein
MNTKKSYETPKITDLGSIVDATHGGGGKGKDNGLGANDGKGS